MWEQLEPAIKQLEKFAQLNRIRVQRMQQAEIRRRAQEQEAMSAAEMEQQRKDFVTQKDKARKDLKLSEQLDRQKSSSKLKRILLKVLHKPKPVLIGLRLSYRHKMMSVKTALRNLKSCLQMKLLRSCKHP